MKRALSILLVLALVSTAVFAQGGQESYPNKNINMTVPYGAGGTTDLTARRRLTDTHFLLTECLHS